MALASTLLALAAPLGFALGWQASLEELARRLASSDASERQEALRALPAVQSLEAWKLVVDALDDPEPRVADAAELALEQLTPSKDAPEKALRALLAGKQGLESRDEWVRTRIAGALGACQLSLEGTSWDRLLNDQQASVRRAACWSIERQAEASKLGDERGVQKRALEKLMKTERDAETRAAAVCALLALDSARLEELLKLTLTAKEPALRSAAALCARYSERDKRQTVLEKLCADPDAGVRAVALEQLRAKASVASAQFLARRLGEESSLRQRWSVVEVLRAWSGKRYGLDPRPWQDWSQALAADWGPEASAPTKDEDESQSRILGLAIRSERIAFLVDMSGSVWKRDTQGKTIKERLDGELKATLESLPETARFNLIPYTATPLPWQERLAPAKPAEVAKALAWFESRKDQGQGDFWSALDVALQDPEVDTIVMLGDGAPSGGRRWNLDLMARLFAERNRFRRVTLDAVLIGGRGFLTDKWRALCAASHGRVIEVR